MLDMKLAGYHIVSNRYEVMVTKMALDDDGKQKVNVTDKGDKVPVETPIGHYGNLKQAISGIRRNMIQAGDTKITTIDDTELRAIELTRCLMTLWISNYQHQNTKTKG